MDPVLLWSGAIALSLLFLSAGLHKIRSPEYYRDLIVRYVRLPLALAGAAGFMAGVIEICTGLLLLLPATRILGAWWAVGLLLAYFFLMTAGLVRGLDMDCGCSGPLGSQKLSGWLLFRNLILTMMAWLLTIPSSSRLTGAIDIVIVLCASVVLIAIYLSFEQLLSNREKLTWLRSG